MRRIVEFFGDVWVGCGMVGFLCGMAAPVVALAWVLWDMVR